MDGQLLIEDQEALELATRLAQISGRDIASAVTQALRDQLAAKEAAATERLHRMTVAVEALREVLVVDGKMPALNTDDLYDDETGLPV